MEPASIRLEATNGEAETSTTLEAGFVDAEPVSEPDTRAESEEHWLQETLLRPWAERAFIFKAALIGFIAASAFALLLPLRFESTVRLMPPDQQSSMSLAMLASKVDERLGGLAGDALGLKSSNALFVGILRSRTVEDRLINRFDLRRVYHVSLWKDAHERLEGNTEIAEDRKSGVITLTVADQSAERAAAIARGYVEEPDRMTAELTTSAAHRERVFIEERLKTVKQDLDAAARDFSSFASKNAAIDISAQGKAMLEAAASLQGEMIAAQSQLSSLKQIYTENNIRVRAAEARVAERQVAQMEGTDASLRQPVPAVTDAASYPSIRMLPILGVPYADLFRRLKIQEAIYETLTKQYELAKIQEAREIPTVRVLDPANVPETKSAPKRTLIVASGTFFAGFLAMVYLLGSDRWQTLEPDHPVKHFTREIQQGLTQDLQAVRKRIPWFNQWRPAYPERVNGSRPLAVLPSDPGEAGRSGHRQKEH
jgi:uncharacterized protein involved in exopolysaccharide biosynthesis